MSSNGNFFSLAAFSNRVQQVGLGGLMISHVTPEDAGRYTVVVDVGDDLSVRRSVTLHVSGNQDNVMSCTELVCTCLW